MKICISGNTQLRLALVKVIKEITGMGLKESKEVVDKLDNNCPFVEIETLPNLTRQDIENRIDEYGFVGLKFNYFDREQKLKRILYSNQENCIRDLMKSASNWEKLVSKEEKDTLTYEQCKDLAFNKIYEEFDEFIKMDPLTEMYKSIGNNPKSLQEATLSLIKHVSLIKEDTNYHAKEALKDFLLVLYESDINILNLMDKIRNRQ